jgi:hypothetical protein
MRAVILGLLGCGSCVVMAGPPASTQPDRSVIGLGRIDYEPLGESSGVVASRTQPGVFWTHNDSGNPPVLYAIAATGKLLAEFPVRATNRDWEDIAVDEQRHLYIAETGNNNCRFNQIAVYRVDEPDVAGKGSGAANPLVVDRSWQLRFPGPPFDCEALFVWRSYGYVISKHLDMRPATLYRFPLVDRQERPFTLEEVGRLPIRSPVTGADLSCDGARLAVVTYTGPYLFWVDGDPPKACDAKNRPTSISFTHPHMEAICFVPPGLKAGDTALDGLLATCESREVLLFQFSQFREDRPGVVDTLGGALDFLRPRTGSATRAVKEK